MASGLDETGFGEMEFRDVVGLLSGQRPRLLCLNHLHVNSLIMEPLTPFSVTLRSSKSLRLSKLTYSKLYLLIILTSPLFVQYALDLGKVFGPLPILILMNSLSPMITLIDLPRLRLKRSFYARRLRRRLRSGVTLRHSVQICFLGCIVCLSMLSPNQVPTSIDW